LKTENKKIKFGIYFFLFFVSNCLLSYSTFSCQIKGWIFFFGIFIPAFFSLGSPTPHEIGMEKIASKETFAFSNATALWLLFGFFSVLIHFYRLTQVYLWPTGDEALHGFLSLSLLRDWHWQFFYTVGEHPPLLIWILALFFKVFKSPFVALWLLPALFSLVTIPLGYFCGREFLSKSASVLFAFFLAFSFWPLYSSRFCHQGLFIPFWEFSSFLLLFRWIKSPPQSRSILWPMLLGIWCGLGTFTFISWIFVLLLLVVAILILAHKKLISNVSLFFISLLLGLFPFVLAALKEGYGHHLADSSALGQWFSISHQAITHFSYITSLFWGSLQKDSSYGPTWGGILNPILTSCFFIGILGFYQERSEALTKWVALAFGLCILPAFLAGDYVELNRIIQVMPFLLLIVVLGLQRLLSEIRDENKRKMALYSLLFFSFLLDANHLLKPTFEYFHLGVKDPKTTSNPNLKAYQILESLRLNRGPGIIFTEFLPVQYGHSLFVTTYPFNSAVNPVLDPGTASWAAILTNIQYQPFLSKRFPESKWYWAGNGVPTLEGGLALGVLSATSANLETIKNWIKVQMVFHEFQLDGEGSYNQKEKYEQSIQYLIQSYDRVKGDPFLEASYWEWVAQYYFSPSYLENIAALQKAIQQGYPAVHLYQKLAVVLSQQHQALEAQGALQKALELEPKFKIGNDFTIEN
jgi:uncharacterized membrane protein